MALAEESLEARSGWRKAGIGAAAVLALLLLAYAGHALRQMMSAKQAPQRQVARIAVLPETPPPPPPPPKEQPRPEPQESNRPPPPDVAPQPAPAPAPANEPLKMDGPAGDGPSAFAAGAVNREYQGGAPVLGASGPARGGPSAADRAAERLYANTARQLLRDAIERHLRAEAAQVQADFTLWLEPDGLIRRFQLQPTGDTTLDGALEAALDETRRTLRLPQPPGAPGALPPMRFRLSVRPQG
ncbi:hypothetical protein AACH10_07260 [Ideonella sp. DXS22W]|uniref:Energy transducer TonB n=1 Tax=Pseudaquabacterium inlustre TaxID=2984192 RepID=A0ABU9CFR1_9BURK